VLIPCIKKDTEDVDDDDDNNNDNVIIAKFEKDNLYPNTYIQKQ
jgi:hypothetical protein